LQHNIYEKEEEEEEEEEDKRLAQPRLFWHSQWHRTYGSVRTAGVFEKKKR